MNTMKIAPNANLRTFRGPDACTDVGRMRTLTISNRLLTVDDYDSSTERARAFSILRPASDSPDYPPTVRRGKDMSGHQFTLIHFHGLDRPILPREHMAIQVWDQAPYELHVAILVQQPDPYTSRTYRMKGPIFRLDEEYREDWNAFMREHIGHPCANCKTTQATHAILAAGQAIRLCPTCASAFNWGGQHGGRRAIPMGSPEDIADLEYYLGLHDASWQQVALTDEETPQAVETVRDWLATNEHLE
jgi:hypothetical protein